MYLVNKKIAVKNRPFGMAMGNRKFTQTSSSYRYSFSGKEKDKDINADDYDFGARIYDGRINRWLSVDPLQKKYPDLSPYQYCANSPISAKDPDGRVIIFINGLWTPGTGVNAPLKPYWNVSDEQWITNAQNRIGDHAQPIYYDGSLGGTEALLKYNRVTNIPGFRAEAGEQVGYKEAATIIKNLSKGETIKIVTNSMGTAFARGFTKGFLKYQADENEKSTTFNAGIDKIIAPLSALQKEIKAFMGVGNKNMTTETINRLTNELIEINTKINNLQARKKELINVQFESETDLSSHQVDFANPDVKNNYYMTTNKLSLVEKAFVNQKTIKGAQYLGNMSVHHSSGAEASSLPPSTTPDPNPPPPPKK